MEKISKNNKEMVVKNKQERKAPEPRAKDRKLFEGSRPSNKMTVVTNWKQAATPASNRDDQRERSINK